MPPTPSEFTAAKRGAPEDGHSRNSVLTTNGLAAKSIFGFAALKLICGGICRNFSASAVLMIAASPAVCSRWPILAFTDPTVQKPRRSVRVRNARVSASISSGSPTIVPVPWHST